MFRLQGGFLYRNNRLHRKGYVFVHVLPQLRRAKDAATADACRVTLAIFFTALLDKEGMGAEQLQRIWREVEALPESVRDGYVSAPDLIRVLRDEYEIDIVGG